MADKKQVLAICGSTRAASTNHNLIQAISKLAKSQFDIGIYDELSLLPHFNPDDDTEHPPETVARFRQKLRAADGILICTPEYAMGVPGTLKNAIDWTVSSCEFSHKPVALITASSVGEKAHASLLGTLNIIEAHITPDSALLIPFASTRISGQNIIHAETLKQIIILIEAFDRLIR